MAKCCFKLTLLNNPIKNMLFIKKGGIPLFSLIDDDHLMHLIVGYLDSIKSFSSYISIGDLCAIQLEDICISFFQPNPNYYIIIMHENEIPSNSLADLINEINVQFLCDFPESHIVNWTHQTTMFNSFIPKLTEMIDSFTQDYLFPLLKGHPKKSWEKMVDLVATRIQSKI